MWAIRHVEQAITWISQHSFTRLSDVMRITMCKDCLGLYLVAVFLKFLKGGVNLARVRHLYCIIEVHNTGELSLLQEHLSLVGVGDSAYECRSFCSQSRRCMSNEWGSKKLRQKKWQDRLDTLISFSGLVLGMLFVRLEMCTYVAHAQTNHDSW